MDEGAARDLEEEKRKHPKALITLDECQREKLKELAGKGLNAAEIAALLDVSRRTFFRLKKRDKSIVGTMKRGKIAANAKVKVSLHDMATSKNFAAARFWAECQMGWITADKRKEIETGSNQKVVVVIGQKPKELEGPVINVSREELLAAAMQAEENDSDEELG